LQRRDGHISYSRTSDQTPVWVTAQALTALRRKPFPLATVPRKKRPKKSRAKKSATATAKRKARAADAAPPTARPRRPQPAAPPPASVRTKAAAAERDEPGDGVPAPLIAGAVAGALGLVLLGRRGLGRRRLT
jgi:hypothetical protein